MGNYFEQSAEAMLLYQAPIDWLPIEQSASKTT